MANEIEIVVSATNQAAQTLGEAAAAARADGEAAGTAYKEGVETGSAGITASISEKLRTGTGTDEEVQAEMAHLKEVMAAEAEQAGQEAGVALADGMVSGTTSLEDRMRAGYDKVLASWQEGTAGFVDAQLQTFADYYGKLAALGDESAAAQLAAIQALAGGTEAAVEEMAVSVSSAVDRMNADFEAAMSRGGKSSGAAFVQGLDASLSEVSLSAQGVSGAFGEISVEAVAAGTQAGDSFAVSFSAASKSAMMSSTVSGISSEAFGLVPQITPAETAAVHNLGAEYASVGGAISEVSNRTVPMGTSLKDLSGSAEGASKSMGGLAAMMYGPLGYAAFGLMSFLPMLSGMFATAGVSAADFTQAVSQDSNATGDNTAVTIQATLAKTGLNDMSKALGVSQATLIEYAAGETQAQTQVTGAYNAKQGALNTASNAEGIHSKAQADAGNSADQESNALYGKKAALDQVTTAVQQAIQQDQANSVALLAAEQSTKIYNAAVNALGAAMLLQVQQTKMSNQAVIEYGTSTLNAMQATGYFDAAVGAAGQKMIQGVEVTKENNTAIVQYGTAVMGAYRDTATFNAALDASYVSMQEQAQTSALTSVGVLNMGDAQTSLNGQLVMAEEAYTQSTSGATAYGAALTALDGDATTLLGSEAAFTTSLNTLTTSVKTNGDALSVNTTKGAANITAIVGIANAADKAAVAVFQNEVNTVGSTKAYEDANAKLAQEKTAFENSAIAAGMNKDKVKQLADQLFQLPPSVDIPINANTSPAQDAVNSLLGQIDSSTAYVNVGTKMNDPKLQATGGVISGAATGGARAGLTWVGEHGPELAQFPTGTTIYPNSNANTLSQSGAGGSGFGSYGAAPALTLEVVGGEPELVALLRKIIRVRGGNAQKVLGVN